MRHQEIAFGVSGQSLVFDAPEGRPSSVTSIEVWSADQDDDAATEPALTGSPAIETNPNTTVDVASGAGNISDRTRINLAATTGIARRRAYLITNELGETEWVEVKEIAAADYVRARVPLMNPYAVGSTFQTTRISQGLDSSWIADENNITEWCPGMPGYRARLEYVVASVTYVHHVYFYLVRYPLQQLVTPLDVDRRFPGWINSLPVDYRDDQGAALIETAYDALLMDAMGDVKELRRVRETRVLRELTIARAVLCSAEQNALAGATRLDQLEVARSIYTQRYQQLMREPKVPIDPGEGGAGAPARRTPLWRR
jgi:hypothetical protein